MGIISISYLWLTYLLDTINFQYYILVVLLILNLSLQTAAQFFGYLYYDICKVPNNV